MRLIEDIDQDTMVGFRYAYPPVTDPTATLTGQCWITDQGELHLSTLAYISPLDFFALVDHIHNLDQRAKERFHPGALEAEAANSFGRVDRKFFMHLESETFVLDDGMDLIKVRAPTVEGAAAKYDFNAAFKPDAPRSDVALWVYPHIKDIENDQDSPDERVIVSPTGEITRLTPEEAHGPLNKRWHQLWRGQIGMDQE